MNVCHLARLLYFCNCVNKYSLLIGNHPKFAFIRMTVCAATKSSPTAVAVNLKLMDGQYSGVAILGVTKGTFEGGRANNGCHRRFFGIRSKEVGRDLTRIKMPNVAGFVNYLQSKPTLRGFFDFAYIIVSFAHDVLILALFSKYVNIFTGFSFKYDV